MEAFDGVTKEPEAGIRTIETGAEEREECRRRCARIEQIPGAW